MQFNLLILAASVAALMSGVMGAPTQEKRDVLFHPFSIRAQGRCGIRSSATMLLDAPTNISNGAMLMLAKGGITAPFILAKGFDLRKGRLEIEVPHVLSGTDYQLVLFGDSGNLSQKFTIKSDT
ncbi:hypothetical protein C8R43DRAFT_1135696 [Mycena crocata]|nr:hypothetical protein C8R43DRAFT_1135696 [Mycena crocata]